MAENTILKNGTNNEALPNSGTTLIGSHLRSQTPRQHIIGQYNNIDGDASTDMFQIGAGTSESSRQSVIRVDQYGSPTILGGEIYMDSTVGSIQLRTPILIETDSKVKKVYIE